jgi:hypothetical protein
MREYIEKPIEDLIPYVMNSRSHSKEQVLQVASSIKEFGFTTPVLIDEEGGVIAGHCRIQAAKKLDFELIPCLIVEGLTEAQKKALVIADNKIAINADWDLDTLKAEFESLAEFDFDLTLTGFDQAELDDLLYQIEEPVEGLTDEEETPDPPPLPVVVLGDVWQLGQHRLLCGDAMSVDAIEKLLDGNEAALLTDPPYGINANKMTLGKGKKDFERGGDWDNKRPELAFLLELFETAVIWGGNYFSDQLPVSNDWLCWDKKNAERSFSEFELAWSNLGKQTRLLSHHWGGEVKLHPTMKPVAVLVWCLELIEFGNIADLFGGSGSVMIACEKLKKRCFMMEIDPVFCDVIVQRWEAFTGHVARHIETGKTFAELQAERNKQGV